MSSTQNALNRQAENVLQMDPNEEVGQVEELGIEWADKDAEASLLEETKKTLLAQLVREQVAGAKATGGKPMSMAQAESLAMSDPRYEAHLKAMIEARREANRARVRYDSGKVKIELMRSLVAARREEMRLGGFRT